MEEKCEQICVCESVLEAALVREREWVGFSVIDFGVENHSLPEKDMRKNS